MGYTNDCLGVIVLAVVAEDVDVRRLEPVGAQKLMRPKAIKLLHRP
jgi:hypothetical protein